MQASQDACIFYVKNYMSLLTKTGRGDKLNKELAQANRDFVPGDIE